MKYGFAQMNIVTFCSENEINPQIYTRTCLIDNKNKIAYNIYTLEEEFPVLDTNEEGLVLPNQKIESGKR